MQKSYLESILEKYYLNGINERSILKIKDKIINISCINPNKNLVSKIEAEFDLEDCELGVYDTTQLLKLVNITDKLISVRVNKSKTISKTLYIDDNVYNLEYPLANTMLIPDVPHIEEPDYDMEANIDIEFITRFIKAAKAVNIRDDKTPLSITISSTLDLSQVQLINFIVGESDSDHTNKVNFSLTATKIGSVGTRVKFPADEFRSILEANKDLETGILKVSEEGLLKLEFENKDKVKSIFILVGKE